LACSNGGSHLCVGQQIFEFEKQKAAAHTHTKKKNIMNNSFDERPEVLNHFTGKHSFSTKVVVDDNVFLLYGRKMGKKTGIQHAGIFCQNTGIWIATLDSIMVKVDDGNSIERMTFGYVALKSIGETVAMCLSHNNFNGDTSFYGERISHNFVANDNCFNVRIFGGQSDRLGVVHNASRTCHPTIWR
jgi:hypothetical protein